MIPARLPSLCEPKSQLDSTAKKFFPFHTTTTTSPSFLTKHDNSPPPLSAPNTLHLPCRRAWRVTTSKNSPSLYHPSDLIKRQFVALALQPVNSGPDCRWVRAGCAGLWHLGAR